MFSISSVDDFVIYLSTFDEFLMRPIILYGVSPLVENIIVDLTKFLLQFV